MSPQPCAVLFPLRFHAAADMQKQLQYRPSHVSLRAVHLRRPKAAKDLTGFEFMRCMPFTGNQI